MNQQVDPQSGNPIPPGGDAEGVRDDVDVKASEGEFIIPQNVVQFYGVKYLTGLIDKANEKLAEMEQSGQIGGEEVPNPEGQLDSADTRAFARGGAVVDYTDNKKNYPGGPSPMPTFNPNDWAALGVSQFMPIGGNETKTEVKNYVNARGQILPVTFVNGQPTSPIPEGFYPEGQLPANQGEEKRPEEEHSDSSPVGGDQQSMMGGNNGPFGGKNPFEMSREELLGSVDNMQNSYQKIDQFSALGGLHPIAAVGVQVAKANSVANMHRAALVAEARGDKTMADSIRSRVDELTGTGLVGNVMDKIASGQRRFAQDRKQFIGMGKTIEPFDMGNLSSKNNRSSGPSDPLSRTSSRASSRSYSGGSDNSPAPSSGGSRSHSSNPGDFSSTSPGGSGGLSFGNSGGYTSSRSTGGSRGSTQHSSTPGDFTSNSPGGSGGLSFGGSSPSRDDNRGSGGLSFKKGGLVKRPSRKQ